MASGVAAESIIFIGAVIAATAFAGVFTAVGNALSDDVRQQGEQKSAELRSDIQILNDPAAVTTSPDLVLYIKNTGDITLDPGESSIVVDGVLQTTVTYDVLGSADDDTWPPGSVVEATVTVSLAGGDHRARVTAGPGATAQFAWSD